MPHTQSSYVFERSAEFTKAQSTYFGNIHLVSDIAHNWRFDKQHVTMANWRLSTLQDQQILGVLQVLLADIGN